jgi:hypothetical protein
LDHFLYGRPGLAAKLTTRRHGLVMPGGRAPRWRKIMGTTTLRNSDMSREIREPTDELSEAKLNTVFGGKVKHGDLQIQKYLDQASNILF